MGEGMAMVLGESKRRQALTHDGANQPRVFPGIVWSGYHPSLGGEIGRSKCSQFEASPQIRCQEKNGARM